MNVQKMNLDWAPVWRALYLYVMSPLGTSMFLGLGQREFAENECRMISVWIAQYKEIEENQSFRVYDTANSQKSDFNFALVRRVKGEDNKWEISNFGFRTARIRRTLISIGLQCGEQDVRKSYGQSRAFARK